MGMRVDQAGMDQPVRRIDRQCLVRSGHAARPDLADRVPLDQDVERLGLGRARAQDDRVADHLVASVLGHDIGPSMG